MGLVLDVSIRANCCDERGNEATRMACLDRAAMLKPVAPDLWQGSIPVAAPAP